MSSQNKNQYTIVVPSKRIGILLTEIQPTIVAIVKENLPLKDKIMVTDISIVVSKKDVSNGFSSMEMSKLLSKHAMNPICYITVSRTRIDGKSKNGTYYSSQNMMKYILQNDTQHISQNNAYLQ